MAINKVVDRNNNVLIDLTEDDVSTNKVLEGTKFHGPDGKIYTGTLKKEDTGLKYTFVDFDGTLVYEFTDEEIDAMTELPAGPDRTAENLTFQSWNWDLESLKNWNRSRPDRPIVGANCITTDGKSYIYFKVSAKNDTFSFSSLNGFSTIDWGDGNGPESISRNHTYAEPGDYMITLDPDLSYTDKGGFSFGGSFKQPYYPHHNIYKVRLGKNTNIIAGSENAKTFFNYQYGLETINIPEPDEGITEWRSSTFMNSYCLRCLVIPRNITTIYSSSYSGFLSMPTDKSYYDNFILSFNPNIKSFSSFCSNYGCSRKIVVPEDSNFSFSFKAKHLDSIYIPTTLKSSISINGSLFKKIDLRNTSCTGCSLQSNILLEEVRLPNTVTSIVGNAFSNCYALKYLNIPDSVTSLGSNIVGNYTCLTLDLSEQTKVINVTSAPITVSSGGNSSVTALIILVPAALIDDYKSASYWSNLANYMIPV